WLRSLKATTEIRSQSRMASFGVEILGAGEVAASRPRGRLQRPPLRLQNSRFAGEEGTLAHRRWRRRAVRRARIRYVRSTDSDRDGERETCGYDSTPRGIQLGPHCGAPPFTGLYTSIQSMDGVYRLHVRARIAFTSSAGAMWVRWRLAMSWGTERGANGPPGLPEHPNASRRCRRWENLSSPPCERSQRWKPGFIGCCAPARARPRRHSGYA